MINNSYQNHLPYRPGVGVALFNRNGKVFLGQRLVDQQGAWQMPQTGINVDETITSATRRELFQELGIAKFRVLAVTSQWFSYDYPAYILSRVHGGAFRGQEQKWVAAQYLGDDTDIFVGKHDKSEFSNWRWEDFDRVPGLIVPYKRYLYKNVYETFKSYAVPMGQNTSSSSQTSVAARDNTGDLFATATGAQVISIDKSRRTRKV